MAGSPEQEGGAGDGSGVSKAWSGRGECRWTVRAAKRGHTKSSASSEMTRSWWLSRSSEAAVI